MTVYNRSFLYPKRYFFIKKESSELGVIQNKQPYLQNNSKYATKNDIGNHSRQFLLAE